VGAGKQTVAAVYTASLCLCTRHYTAVGLTKEREQPIEPNKSTAGLFAFPPVVRDTIRHWEIPSWLNKTYHRLMCSR
jgi:hypothetical protein